MRKSLKNLLHIIKKNHVKEDEINNIKENDILEALNIFDSFEKSMATMSSEKEKEREKEREKIEKEKSFIIEKINSDENLKKDKSFILQALKINPYVFKEVDESLKKDKNFILEAVKRDPIVLYYADESLKKNKDFILEAIKVNPKIFEDLDENLKKDKEIILEAVRKNPAILDKVDKSIKKDKDFALDAVRTNGYSIIYFDFDRNLQTDKELVLAAIMQCGTLYGRHSILFNADVILGKSTIEFVKHALKLKKGDSYFIESNQCEDSLKNLLGENTPLLVQYLGENKFKEMTSGKEIKYEGKVNNLSDELKATYYQKVLSNNELKNAISLTLNAHTNQLIRDVDKARELAGVDKYIYNKKEDFYFINSEQCNSLKHLFDENTPLLVQYLGENKFKEMTSGKEIKYEGKVNNLSDELKATYYQKVLSNNELKNAISLTLNAHTNQLIRDVDKARELAEVDNYIYNETHEKTR